MAQIQLPDGKQVSEWIRYRDGLWIPYRKVNYLYWFRFLQMAERNPELTVNWRKYKLWGGQNAVMGMSFDNWWRDHWKECFGIPDRKDKQNFPFTSIRPKTESIRLSWLCYRFKDVPISGKFQVASAHNNRTRGFTSNAVDVANAVYRFEMGIDKRRKKPRDAMGEGFTYHQLNPTGSKYNDKSGEFEQNDTIAGQKEIRDTVNKALRRARQTMGRVCEGHFP